MSTPNTTGLPVSRPTRMIPAAAWPATCSKCAVSPRITQPRQITASWPAAIAWAASGTSNAPGTHVTVMSSSATPARGERRDGRRPAGAA